MIVLVRQRRWFPGWRHLGRAALLALGVLIVFCVVYGGTDFLSRGRTLVKVHLDAEQSIPFVPAMTLAYVSMYGLLVLAPFVLRSERELRALSAALVAAILTAGVCFLLWPAEAAFPAPDTLGIWAGLYHAADEFNLHYNMVPSLHVALSIATAATLAHHCKPWGAAVLWCWGGLVSLSTVLIHQHHLLDVATGVALGVAVDRVIFCRLASREHSATSGSKTSGQPGAGSKTVGLTAPNFCPRATEWSTNAFQAAGADVASNRTSSGPS